MKIHSLEDAFSEACKKHPQLKLLESQWRFDKDLISKALQNISSLFPHYSLHDASHSRQIIVNIERILGDKIKHLSATDMWLILEAAYNHDIGMVVTHRQIQDMDTPEFREYLQEIIDDKDHPKNEFCTSWMEGEANLPNGAAAHEMFQEYLQFISEWFRRKHPENSAKIINNPQEEIGLNSPRNELLPKRLFGALASICDAHGQSFDQVLKLPFSETGMATEDCHPRFIAFLLRLGDLLDVDDNRFCPVMMRTCGQTLPPLSQAHYEKHQSIKHFRLDSERIEVEVSCPTPESYEQAYAWFSWLEEEHYRQLQKWNEIAPSKKVGRLPTLAKPVVKMAPPYITLNKGEKPRFQLDNDAVSVILRSTGLYASKTESIREILQNAVDSILIAIWMENKRKITELSPISPEIESLYSERKIQVNLEQCVDNPDFLELKVSDSGLGICEDELRHMLKIGSSSKYREKAKAIREMPIWFRPSGHFGIGLQSLFLLSDEFSILTKSRRTHRALEITFSKSQVRPVLISQENPNDVEYGATLTVRIPRGTFPQRITFDFSASQKLISGVLADYDFIDDESDLSGYEMAQIDASLLEFNEGSPIKIIKNGKDLETSIKKTPFFYEETKTVLNKIEFQNRQHAQVTTRFRGQRIDLRGTGLEMMIVDADFYGYTANELITYNREKVLPEAWEGAVDNLIKTIMAYIEKSFESLPPYQKTLAACVAYNNTSKEKRERYITDALKVEISHQGDYQISIGELVAKLDENDGGTIIKTALELEQEEIEEALLVVYDHTSSYILDTIHCLALEKGLFWSEQVETREEQHEIVRKFNWSRVDSPPFGEDDLAKVLNGYRRHGSFGKRYLYPAWGEYRNLALLTFRPWTAIHRRHWVDDEYMVLPLDFSSEGTPTFDTSEKFIEDCFKKRKSKEISLDEFRQLYLSLVQYLSSLRKTNHA
ncbi:HD domain-containing protein [Pseudomonas abyssi]|uniref:HD domain-containing protein n=1 Tax=Pseudomonas abyssi TaxID=170540 RepID=UPI003C7D65BB